MILIQLFVDWWFQLFQSVLRLVVSIQIRLRNVFKAGLSLLHHFFRKRVKSNLLPMISSLSPSSANFCVGLFHLIDTPAGLVPNFDKIIRKYIDGIELQLIRTNPR